MKDLIIKSFYHSFICSFYTYILKVPGCDLIAENTEISNTVEVYDGAYILMREER